MWANTLCPFSSSTRNMALGRGSMTVPSSTIASSFGFGRVGPLLTGWDGGSDTGARRTESPAGPTDNAIARGTERKARREGSFRRRDHLLGHHPAAAGHPPCRDGATESNG